MDDEGEQISRIKLLALVLVFIGDAEHHYFRGGLSTQYYLWIKWRGFVVIIVAQRHG